MCVRACKKSDSPTAAAFHDISSSSPVTRTNCPSETKSRPSLGGRLADRRSPFLLLLLSSFVSFSLQRDEKDATSRSFICWINFRLFLRPSFCLHRTGGGRAVKKLR